MKSLTKTGGLRTHRLKQTREETIQCTSLAPHLENKVSLLQAERTMVHLHQAEVAHTLAWRLFHGLFFKLWTFNPNGPSSTLLLLFWSGSATTVRPAWLLFPLAIRGLIWAAAPWLSSGGGTCPRGSKKEEWMSHLKHREGPLSYFQYCPQRETPGESVWQRFLTVSVLVLCFGLLLIDQMLPSLGPGQPYLSFKTLSQ